MTEQQKETQDSNVLLAVFMGYIDNGCGEDGFLIHPTTNHDVDINSLCYDNCWQMLMQVVDKIEIINDGAYDVGIHSDSVLIINWKSIETIASSENGRTKIENVYNACVDFVKWYNLNKKTHE